MLHYSSFELTPPALQSEPQTKKASHAYFWLIFQIHVAVCLGYWSTLKQTLEMPSICVAPLFYMMISTSAGLWRYNDDPHATLPESGSRTCAGIPATKSRTNSYASSEQNKRQHPLPEPDPPPPPQPPPIPPPPRYLPPPATQEENPKGKATKEKLSVIQLNINVANDANMADLLQLARDSGADVLLLQEHRWHPVHNPPPEDIEDFQLFWLHSEYATPKNACGGAAILVKNGIKCFPNTTIDTAGLCAIFVDFPHLTRRFTIGSCYIPPQDHKQIPRLNTIFASAPQHILLGGDFNASHIQWDDYALHKNHDSHRAGRRLLKVIENNSLFLLNDKTPTHRQSKDTDPSTIDLTLSSSPFSPYVSAKVYDILPFQHHKPIFIEIQSRVHFYPMLPRKILWKTKSADRRVFQEKCDQVFAQFTSSHVRLDVHAKFSRFISCLLLIGTKFSRVWGGGKFPPFFSEIETDGGELLMVWVIWGGGGETERFPPPPIFFGFGGGIPPKFEKHRKLWE